ncbi:MAG: DUF6456 domain-containing protein [Mesorhizobium sp.]
MAQILLALTGGPMQVVASDGEKLTLRRKEGGDLTVSSEELTILAARSLVRRTGSSIALSVEGRAQADLLSSATDPLGSSHPVVGPREMDVDGTVQTVVVNLAESPLANLMRRRGRDGRAFLSVAEFEAGERLRADFTRARMMPRLGANWDAAISTGKRGQTSTDLTDGAVAARIRVDDAVVAVGPELSGVLIDVCCFLKGLEMVEAERRWPARSAKLMLKAALGSLARHYHPPRRKRSAILSWGGEGYRPQIGR